MAEKTKVVHPGKILLEEVMKPLGVSRNRLARDIDVPVGRISAIVSGSRAITADTALRFGRYFGTTAELWMRLQAEYELAVARNTVWRQVESRVRVFQPGQPEPAEDDRASEAAPAEVAPEPVAEPAAPDAPPAEAQEAPGIEAEKPPDPPSVPSDPILGHAGWQPRDGVPPAPPEVAEASLIQTHAPVIEPPPAAPEPTLLAPGPEDLPPPLEPKGAVEPAPSADAPEEDEPLELTQRIDVPEGAHGAALPVREEPEYETDHDPEPLAIPEPPARREA